MDIQGEEVKAYRKAQKLTQQQFADAACVSVPTVKNWEKKGISEKRVQEAKMVIKISNAKK